ncbi:MAG: RNA methyltransferase [Bdellovibrionaceae bacterium]|nr:RNA methyltransferase [Pseudobdellovibrionaceae bacterium]NUM58152.1 RNA methyltransferase [Pseudobdellovibrionaceae bacterium]
MNSSFFLNEIISSEQNPKFKIWKSLLQSKGRKKENLFLLSGEKVITDFVNDLKENSISSTFKIETILIPKKNSDEKTQNLLKSLNSLPLNSFNSSKKLIFFSLETSLFSELDIIGSHFPILVIHFEDLQRVLTLQDLAKPEGLEILCPIGDPGNLGSLARTALAFGVKKIILTKNSCDPFHPKCLKSSSGAILKNHLIYLDKNLNDITISELDENNFGLDFGGISLEKFLWPENIRLWLGEEGPGLITFPKKQILSIPIKQVESLNVTVAGSLAIYSYFQKHMVRS